MGIKTVAHPPYSPDLAPCDFWFFPKLGGCRYETIEEMKEAVTKVIDTITQKDFHSPSWLEQTLVAGILRLCRDTVGEFYSPSRLGQTLIGGVLPLCRDVFSVFYCHYLTGLLTGVSKLFTFHRKTSQIELLMLMNNTWNYLTVYKQMSSNTFKNKVTNKLFAYNVHIYIYIYKPLSKTKTRAH